MKKISFFLLIILFISGNIIFSQDVNDFREKIIGTWKIEMDTDGNKYKDNIEGYNTAIKNNYTTAVNSDNTYVTLSEISKDGVLVMKESKGRWSISDNILTIVHYNENNEVKSSETYKILFEDNYQKATCLLLTTTSEIKREFINKLKVYIVKQN